MEKGQQLPHKIKKVWYLQELTTFIIGMIVSAVFLFVIHFFSWPEWLKYILPCLILIDLAIELPLVTYRYRFYRYRFSHSDVEIETGFFFRRQTAIPISRIQNVTLEAGPLLQLFNLQAVNIETAATSHSITGVSLDTAEALKKQLIELAEVNNDEE